MIHVNSFFLRGIRLWNKLPPEINDTPTVPAFTSGLTKFYALVVDIHMYKLVFLQLKKLTFIKVLNCQCCKHSRYKMYIHVHCLSSSFCTRL